MSGSKPKPQPPPDKETEKIKGKLKRKVENLEKVSDVLTGKDLPEGKIGERIKRQREIDKSLVTGKKSRDKKYKAFDEWLTRQQYINNTVGMDNGAPAVRLKRKVVYVKSQDGKGGTLL